MAENSFNSKPGLSRGSSGGSSGFSSMRGSAPLHEPKPKKEKPVKEPKPKKEKPVKAPKPPKEPKPEKTGGFFSRMKKSDKPAQGPVKENRRVVVNVPPSGNRPGTPGQNPGMQGRGPMPGPQMQGRGPMQPMPGPQMQGRGPIQPMPGPQMQGRSPMQPMPGPQMPGGPMQPMPGPQMPGGPMQSMPGPQMQGGPMQPMPGPQMQGGPMQPMPGPQMQEGPMQPQSLTGETQDVLTQRTAPMPPKEEVQDAMTMKTAPMPSREEMQDAMAGHSASMPSAEEMQNVLSQATTVMPEISDSDLKSGSPMSDDMSEIGMQPVTYSASDGNAQPIPPVPEDREPLKADKADDVSGSDKQTTDNVKAEDSFSAEDDIKAEDSFKSDSNDKAEEDIDNDFNDNVRSEAGADNVITDDVRSEAVIDNVITDAPGSEAVTDNTLNNNSDETADGPQIRTDAEVPASESAAAFTAAPVNPAVNFDQMPEAGPQNPAFSRATTELPKFDELFEPPEEEPVPLYERNIYKAPPIMNNQKPVARTSIPVILDPEKADVLERANKPAPKPEKGRSMGRSMQKPAKPAKAPKPPKAPKAAKPLKTGRPQRAGLGDNNNNMAYPAGSPAAPYSQPMPVNSFAAQAPPPEQAPFAQAPAVTTVTSMTPQGNIANAPVKPQTVHGSMHDRRAAADQNPDHRAARRNQDGSLKREQTGRRATDALIFGFMPRSTMSLIFLIVLIGVSFVFALMLTEVKVPVLIIIVLIEVIMGVFLSRSPSFVCILIAAALTLAGALTDFFIPVCIGNAIMLSAYLVMKGE